MVSILKKAMMGRMNSSVHVTFFTWVDYWTHTEPIMRYAMNEAVNEAADSIKYRGEKQ